MQRHIFRALTTSIYPLIGLAGLLAMSGCAAVPLANMASSLMKPAAPAMQPGAYSPSADIISALAQRMGITLPAQPATTPVTALHTTPAAPVTTTTATAE